MLIPGSGTPYGEVGRGPSQEKSAVMAELEPGHPDEENQPTTIDGGRPHVFGILLELCCSVFDLHQMAKSLLEIRSPI
jgi:hypothetical protein